METEVFAQHKRVSVRRARHAFITRAACSRVARLSQAWRCMKRKRPIPLRATVKSLRAEARLLTTAGLILLAIGFPLTLLLVAQALAPNAHMPAMLPFAAGAPFIVLGYLACHFASQRMVKAKAMERR